jgi:hypothetical protein
MKVVINKCFGGFGISKECAERMNELGNKVAKELLEDYENRLKCPDDIEKKWGVRFYGSLYEEECPRHDKALVQAVEELGNKANGDYAKLKIVEIPDDIEYEIDDYDGMESIHEVHRSWR